MAAWQCLTQAGCYSLSPCHAKVTELSGEHNVINANLVCPLGYNVVEFYSALP